MKLVQEKYGDEKQLIVSEGIIQHGICFGDNQCDLLSDAPKEVFEAYLVEKAEYDTPYFFHDYLAENGYDYMLLPNENNITDETAKTWIADYKYWYNSYEDSYSESEGILSYEEMTFLEYWDGHNTKQVDIDDEIIDLVKIESQIDGYNFSPTHQYDLYKTEDGILYLHENNYYQGDLGAIEEVSEDLLKERFDYSIELD